MKAETPIQQLIKKFENLKSKAESLKDIIYLDGVLAVLDTSIEPEKEYIKTYARIQIEKDREMVKDAVHESGLYHNHIGLDKIYKNTPINLD